MNQTEVFVQPILLKFPMATLDSEPEPTPSTSPTPPPIPTSPDHHINGISTNPNRASSYRLPSKRNSFNKNFTSIYDSTNIKSKTGTLLHGAPTKETRLLEYFLVISYGKSLKIRQRSPLMDIFDNFQKRVHHHHAYIIHPQQQKKNRDRKSSKHRKSKRKKVKSYPSNHIFLFLCKDNNKIIHKTQNTKTQNLTNSCICFFMFVYIQNHDFIQKSIKRLNTKKNTNPI